MRITTRLSTLIENINKSYRKQMKKDTFTITDLVDVIYDCYERYDHVSILIQGMRGAGKTTLLAHILAIVYNNHGIPSYTKALEYIYFNPIEALKKILEYVKKGEIVIAMGFDDAGSWLSKWTVTKEKASFLEASNLFREAIGGAIYTDVGSIQKYIRHTSNLIIQVEKLTPDKMRKIYEALPNDYKEIIRTAKMEWSMARVYESHFDVFHREWIKRKAIMIFPLWLPDHFRKKYKEKRLRHTKLLLIRSLKQLLIEYREELEKGLKELEREEIRLL